jgi:hypothetical protein
VLVEGVGRINNNGVVGDEFEYAMSRDNDMVELNKKLLVLDGREET